MDVIAAAPPPGIAGGAHAPAAEERAGSGFAAVLAQAAAPVGAPAGHQGRTQAGKAAREAEGMAVVPAETAIDGTMPALSAPGAPPLPEVPPQDGVPAPAAQEGTTAGDASADALVPEDHEAHAAAPPPAAPTQDAAPPAQPAILPEVPPGLPPATPPGTALQPTPAMSGESGDSDAPPPPLPRPAGEGPAPQRAASGTLPGTTAPTAMAAAAAPQPHGARAQPSGADAQPPGVAPQPRGAGAVPAAPGMASPTAQAAGAPPAPAAMRASAATTATAALPDAPAATAASAAPPAVGAAPAAAAQEPQPVPPAGIAPPPGRRGALPPGPEASAATAFLAAATEAPALAPDRAPAPADAPRAPPGAAPARQIAPVVVAVAIGGGTARLSVTLEPAELGRVEISVERTGDAAQIRILAERPETLALLQRDQAEIERTLTQSGIAAEGRSVALGLAGQGPGSGGAQHRRGEGAAGGARPGRGGPAEAASDAAIGPAAPRRIVSLLDLAI